MVDPKHNLLHYNLNLENDLNISASRNDSLSSRNLEKLETLLKQDGICFVENIDPTLEITKLAEGVVDHFLNFPRAGTIDKIDTQSFLNGNISNKQLQEHRIFPSTIGKIIEGGASCTKTSWKLRSSKHIWNFLKKNLFPIYHKLIDSKSIMHKYDTSKLCYIPDFPRILIPNTVNTCHPYPFDIDPMILQNDAFYNEYNHEIIVVEIALTTVPITFIKGSHRPEWVKSKTGHYRNDFQPYAVSKHKLEKLHGATFETETVQVPAGTVI